MMLETWAPDDSGALAPQNIAEMVQMPQVRLLCLPLPLPAKFLQLFIGK